MTTYLIFPDTNDGYITSRNANYATAQAGSNLAAVTTGDILKVGQNISGAGEYHIHQSFLSFDTSVIADAEEIVDATITGYMGFPVGQTTKWGQQFRSFNWTAPLTTAQWQTPALARTRTNIANFDHLFGATPYQWRSTGRDTLIGNISKTAATKFVMVSNTYAEGVGPAGAEEVWMDGGDSVNKPYLTVHTLTLNALANVSEASTTLPDGMTISIRSNGAAGPTMTLGRTVLTSTTFTSMGTVHADFAKNIDGANTLTLASDAAGNFFIIGVKTGTTATIVVQAWLRTGTTTWTAQPVVSQALPRGTEETVRSLEAVYLPAGVDSTDTEAIVLMAVRGSAGNRPEYPYHLSGAGFPQNALINPRVALGTATGNLFMSALNDFDPLPASGIPANTDVVALDKSTVAVYVQRGKFSNNTVGGIAVLRKYGSKMTLVGKNTTYAATGAALLVPVSGNLFALVFDDTALSRLSITFYNAECVVLGSTSIPKESFFGGKVDNQWAAHYDKTANLVRVYYIAAAASRSLDRADVSPVTFSATVTANVTTTLGSTGTTNSNLRISRTSDERRVLIEAANLNGATHGTATYLATVGNIAPSAPSQVTRQNFDSTSPATFEWKFSDPNPADYQTAYELEISRVSDSVVVHTTGKITSTVSSHTLAANVLANAIDHRWRVRTWDVPNSTGTWSAYGTFTTAATGTITITEPAADNQAGIETSSYLVKWTYEQSGGQTQTHRRVKVTRTSDSTVVSDSFLDATTGKTRNIYGLESGKEYLIEVSVRNSAGIDVPAVTRLITPYYSEPMTPSLEIHQRDSYNELVTVNPTPTGERPEVIYNDIYKRRTKAGATAADFKKIATVPNSATYRDYAIKSGAIYDYYIVGQTV